MKYLIILILGSPIASADYYICNSHDQCRLVTDDNSDTAFKGSRPQRGQQWDEAFATRIQAAIAERARRDQGQSSTSGSGYATPRHYLPDAQQKPLVEATENIDPSDSYGTTGVYPTQIAPAQRTPASVLGAK